MIASPMKLPQMGASIDKVLAEMNTEEPKKRGRPPSGNGSNGSNGKKVGVTKWIPKEWKPVYEQIVALDCMNVPHIAIAAQFNFTKQYISMIVNTPQAKIIRRKISLTLAEKNEEFQAKRFEQASSKAMQRVSDFLEDDSLYEDNPFAVVEKALKVLTATGAIGSSKTESKRGDNIFQGNVTINNLQGNQLIELSDGLKLTREAQSKHEDVIAIDVTSPTVETGRMK